MQRHTDRHKKKQSCSFSLLDQHTLSLFPKKRSVSLGMQISFATSLCLASEFVVIHVLIFTE